MTHWLALASIVVPALALEPHPDPSTSLWYASPAASWETEALPIGNGRIGAMIFGGVDRERIALNEESVWSGTRTDWNRPDASRHLPEIRRLLLEGRNIEAEALVNQSFTCTGGGSKGGANGPWGCFQELGNLRIDWKSVHPPLLLETWKSRMIEARGGGDIRQQRVEIQRLVDEAVLPEVDDRGWGDYRLPGETAPKGAGGLAKDERVVLRHRFTLDAGGGLARSADGNEELPPQPRPA